MTTRHPLLLIALTTLAPAQAPDLAKQREALHKLDFLIGKWSGEATVNRDPEPSLRLTQTEDVQPKLDGLVLLLEGTGRDPSGTAVFQALATISYDDAASTYSLRSYEGGRYLDNELTVLPNGFSWSFSAGPAHVTNTMRLDSTGAWSEVTQTTAGHHPASHFCSNAAPPRRVSRHPFRRPVAHHRLLRGGPRRPGLLLPV